MGAPSSNGCLGPWILVSAPLPTLSWCDRDGISDDNRDISDGSGSVMLVFGYLRVGGDLETI